MLSIQLNRATLPLTLSSASLLNAAGPAKVKNLVYLLYAGRLTLLSLIGGTVHQPSMPVPLRPRPVDAS